MDQSIMGLSQQGCDTAGVAICSFPSLSLSANCEFWTKPSPRCIAPMMLKKNCKAAESPSSHTFPSLRHSPTQLPLPLWGREDVAGGVRYLCQVPMSHLSLIPPLQWERPWGRDLLLLPTRCVPMQLHAFITDTHQFHQVLGSIQHVLPVLDTTQGRRMDSIPWPAFQLSTCSSSS